MYKTLIIAEAGVNHNGSLDVAKRLIDAAVDAGADVVKFQTFDAASQATRYAKKASYQYKNDPDNHNESHFEMLRRLQLTRDSHYELLRHSQERGILFLSSAFDIPSIDFLSQLGMEFFKIPSGEITNFPYLAHIAKFGKPVILSTGMASLGEVELAIGVLQKFGVSIPQITLLHCTSEYPSPMNEVNLLAMQSMHKAFGLPVGYSDHTTGIEVAVAAVALGACVIEKHITLDFNLPGPDHKSSMEPDDFKSMVRAIRNVEIALGDGIKRATVSEIQTRLVARKSIVARGVIKMGEIFGIENIAVKRPGSGISPMRWNEVIGRVAPRDFSEDELIEL